MSEAQSESNRGPTPESRLREAVASIVETLWPDCGDGDWREAVRERVAALREERERTRAQNQSTVTADDLPDNFERTKNIEELKAAIEAVDVRKVARQVADEYDTAPGRDPVRFAAPWHATHDSGTSCFVDREKFVDLEEGAEGGGALTLAARADGIISHCRESVNGEDAKGRSKFWLAVNALRGLGFDIPYFTGYDGMHPDGLGLYEDPESEEDKRRQVLRAALARE
jgi:hypothetical protein